jgi:hypothetical protein
MKSTTWSPHSNYSRPASLSTLVARRTDAGTSQAECRGFESRRPLHLAPQSCSQGRSAAGCERRAPSLQRPDPRGCGLARHAPAAGTTPATPLRNLLPSRTMGGTVLAYGWCAEHRRSGVIPCRRTSLHDRSGGPFPRRWWPQWLRVGARALPPPRKRVQPGAEAAGSRAA